jgi:hypothetical protein
LRDADEATATLLHGRRSKFQPIGAFNAWGGRIFRKTVAKKRPKT